MMRSLFSGVSGLRVHQTRMDVIANNISNVNTVGFKASRTTFADAMNQMVQGASGPQPEFNRGGVNPVQIGLGVNLASIDKLMTQGAAQRTDRPMDVMIQGEGFFIVGDVSGTFFTRAGNFNLDPAGNLVTFSGLQVQGWEAIDGPYNNGLGRIERGVIQPIVIGPDRQSVGAEATSMLEFRGNLNYNEEPTRRGTKEFFDSLGNLHTVEVLYVFAGNAPGAAAGDGNFAEWRVYMSNEGRVNGSSTETAPFPLDAAGGIGAGAQAFNPEAYPHRDPGMPNTGTAWQSIGSVFFTPQGNFAGSAVTAAPPALPSPLPDPLPMRPALPAGTLGRENLYLVFGDHGTNMSPPRLFGGDHSIAGTLTPNSIQMDFSNMTQFSRRAADVRTVRTDGNIAGNLMGVSIGPDGRITGRYTNGDLRYLGQLAVARFDNPAGLEKVGDNLYVETANSGPFDGIGQDVMADGSRMMGGVLEMSNVDLADQFTDMIITQRGFQANSRSITTSDEMLIELVNLKR